MEKHGWEVFRKVILHERIPYADRNTFERAYIADFNTYHNGYNCTTGGSLRSTYKASASTRKKMSDAKRVLAAEGKLNTQTETPEQKASRSANISKTHKEKIARGEFWYQKPSAKRTKAIAKRERTKRKNKGIQDWVDMQCED